MSTSGFNNLNEYRLYLKETLDKIDHKIDKLFTRYDRLNEASIRQDEKTRTIREDMTSQKESYEERLKRIRAEVDAKVKQLRLILFSFNIPLLLGIIALVIRMFLGR